MSSQLKLNVDCITVRCSCNACNRRPRAVDGTFQASDPRITHCTGPLLHRYARVLLLTTLLGLGSTVHAVADHCTTRYSDEIDNASPTGATFVAVSPFDLTCRGGISGSLNVISGGITDTQLQIEKQVSDKWIVVDRGNYISHRAEPGTYRLTVEHDGKRGGYASWRLRYSKPLP